MKETRDSGEELDRARSDVVAAAKAILSLARTAGMPDTYMQTDRRCRLARRLLSYYDPGRGGKEGSRGS